MNYPFDDDYMIYDFDSHRYVLTPKCVFDELNVNLAQRLNVTGSANAQIAPNQVLNQISTTVYSEIYDRSNQNEIQEYALAKCPSLRKIIKEAMKQQVLYFLFNGDVSVYGGVDVKKGTKAPSYNDRILAPMAEKILSRPVKELGGVSILYGGHYPIVVKLDYETENY